MPDSPLVSYAQNGEDVVLLRALGHLARGTYVDIGANDPVVDSISWAFYQRGWRGITAEPVAALAAAHRAARPGDVQVEAVVGQLDVDEVVLHEIAGTGLSTIEGDIAGRHAQAGWTVTERAVPVRRLDDVLAGAGWDDGRDLHLMTIDTEGSEAAVLASLDLRRYRPWVLVVEATAPTSSTPTHQQWEQQVLDADYAFCLFDGLSRFYVAAEHADRLGPALSYPACVLDEFVTVGQAQDRAAADARLLESQTWRAEALRHITRAATRAHEIEQARRELAALTATEAEARWHEGLLLEERDWLRGLLEQEREAHLPQEAGHPVLDRVVARYPALPASPAWRVLARGRRALRGARPT